MRKFVSNKKHILISLMLILIISGFRMAFAYWDNNIVNTQVSVSVGEWDFEDTASIVATYRSDYEVVLALTEETVTISDKAAVEAALAAYGLLSEDAQAELFVEEALLIGLLNQIIALENSEFIDFESNPYDSGLTGTLDINGRTWYANDVWISNDPNYDVWNDTRSLALRSTSYFESQDLFINGIDRISIYHGALNYGNGTSYQFKVEYELGSNPGVWLTLQAGGTDLLIDVTSSTPLGYSEIDVNITEAVNIRFTPVISTTSDYINLDDIRIYEHVVTSALEATTFRTIYAGALALNVGTVEISDKEIVEQALAAYELLSVDAKALLTVEKALLDSLLIEINVLEAIEEAETFVIVAENSNLQTDVDAAQILVTALPDGLEKTALQDRLDQVQDIIDEITSFPIDHAAALALTVGTVTPSDQAVVEAALIAYESLSDDAKAALTTEKALLDSLLVEINNQIPTETQVAQFQSDHAVVLALTVETVTPSDKAGVQAALSIYESLSVDAKALLTVEKALLDSLLVEINLQEAISAAEALVVIAEGSNLQADLDAAQILVTALPNGTEKTSLQARLDVVQNTINSLAAASVDALITALPSSGGVVLTDQTQIETARTAYNALTTTQQALVVNEAMLSSVEAELAALQLATASVVIAEGSNVQADVNSAQALVTALPNGAAKTDLQSRLNAVQDRIDVEAAKLLIISYFDSNLVVVTKLNNATAIKEIAFTTKANEAVTGLGVTISITNTNEVDRRNTTYTIVITKNGASVTVDVDVTFTR